MLRPGHFFGRLLGAGLGVIPPLVAPRGCPLYQQHQRAEALAYRSVSSRAAEKAKDLQELLQRARALLDVIASRADVVSLDPQRCADAVNGFATFDPLYTNLGAFAADGTLVCSANPRPRDKPAPSFADAPWFRDALEGNAPRLSPPMLGGMTQTMVSMLSVPLRDATGRQVGLVALSL